MVPSGDLMRAAVWHNNHDVRVQDVPVPHIGPGELLVRVEASGICGSDIMEWYRLDRAPLILGHEIGGQVIVVGEGVTGYREGDRVTAAHHVPCNTCRHCLSGHHTVCDTLHQTSFDPGGFAQFIRLSAINVDRGVFLLPAGVSYEAATLVEPLACVLRAQRRAGMGPGRAVLVLGSGISGLLHIQLARSLGASFIMATDLSEYRLRAARQFGAHVAVHAREDIPRHLREANGGRLADLVIVCTGAATAPTQAIQCVERGGTVQFFAPTDPGFTLPLPINDIFWRNDITLTTSYAADPSDYRTALDLVNTATLPVRETITHRLPLSEAGQGFRLMAEPQESIKVVLYPQLA